MKKIRVIISGILLSLLLIVPVYAEEKSAGYDDVQVSNYTGDKPFERDGEKVYSISAQRRETNGAFEQTADQIITLKSITTDFYGITAEMKTETGKKDITVKVIKISEDGKEAQISVNFSSRLVTTNLNMNEAILVKKDNQLLKRILFAYSTPSFQDEHYDGFNSLDPWSGTWEYENGFAFKLSGIIDVYQNSPILTYTYTAEGKQGVKAFHLNPEGNFTFADGSTTYTEIDHQPKAVNKIRLKCKTSYLSKLKEELLDEISYDEDSWQMNAVFDDLLVEYEDGCYIGGTNDPIYLGHTATLKPLGKVSLETSAKSAGAIKLQWNKMTSVSGYCIYRSEKKNTGYKKIKTVSGNTLSYTDKNLQPGKNYNYKIRTYRDIYYKSSRGQSKTKRLYGTYSGVSQTRTTAGKKSVSVNTTEKKKTTKAVSTKRNGTVKASSPQMGDETAQNDWILLGLSGMIATGIICQKIRHKKLFK